LPAVRALVNVDGGARGNPGPAAAAAVLSSPAGEVIDSRGELIGEATNNVAEYRAMMLGIELAKSHGVTELELIGDSELIVRQIKGEWKIKNKPLQALRAEVVAALGGFEKWSARSVPREQNEAADALVNETLDAG
jgi:ribonuclease HI